mmetsp:Transcript_69613/g.116963  ORF Transcript_69613/g.116963 Transcript_69613/m.116963 type:complete len:203 (+) Transcript_69613:114-722(+)
MRPRHEQRVLRRAHGRAEARDCNPNDVLLELFGDGGGSMHRKLQPQWARDPVRLLRRLQHHHSRGAVLQIDERVVRVHHGRLLVQQRQRDLRVRGGLLPVHRRQYRAVLRQRIVQLLRDRRPVPNGGGAVLRHQRRGGGDRDLQLHFRLGVPDRPGLLLGLQHHHRGAELHGGVRGLGVAGLLQRRRLREGLPELLRGHLLQ